jgi:hypothetical protein
VKGIGVKRGFVVRLEIEMGKKKIGVFGNGTTDIFEGKRILRRGG